MLCVLMDVVHKVLALCTRARVISLVAVGVRGTVVGRGWWLVAVGVRGTASHRCVSLSPHFSPESWYLPEN